LKRFLSWSLSDLTWKSSHKGFDNANPPESACGAKNRRFWAVFDLLEPVLGRFSCFLASKSRVSPPRRQNRRFLAILRHFVKEKRFTFALPPAGSLLP
jgi:hypothetical protein